MFRYVAFGIQVREKIYLQEETIRWKSRSGRVPNFVAFSLKPYIIKVGHVHCESVTIFLADPQTVISCLILQIYGLMT
jgi:hypothetical protein